MGLCRQHKPRKDVVGGTNWLLTSGRELELELDIHEHVDK